MRISRNTIRFAVLVLAALVLVPFAVTGRSGTVIVTPPWNHCLGMHKVSQFHLDIFSGYREKFDDPQGLFCVKLLCEDDTTTAKDDDELTVFGLNSGKNTLIYNKSLTSIGIIGKRQGGLHSLSGPQAVTGDRSGNIYIADSGNDRILHLRYREGELDPAGEIRGPAGLPLSDPSGVSFSGGHLYVADRGNDRIAVFASDGTLEGEIIPDFDGLRFMSPLRVAAVTEGDEWLYYRDYFIAVIDSMGQRLWKMTPDGAVRGIVRYRSIGTGGGFNHVAVDYYGNLYVTDTGKNVIHKFNRHLDYIVAIGGNGRGDVQFDEPRGIAIYRRFGQIFVSERAGAQYYWIGTDMLRLVAKNLHLDSRKGACAIDISFLLTEHSSVTIHLEDENGKVMVPIVDGYLLPSGHFERRIEVACENVQSLAKYKFRLVVVAIPTYSSKAFLEVTKKSRLLEPLLNSGTSSNTH